MPSPRRRASARPLTTVALTVVLAVVLAACGFDSPTEDRPEARPAPSASARPLPSAEPSRPTPRESAGLDRFYRQELVWEQCRRDFECSTVEVPLDYDEPAGASISLALLRVPASGAGATVGSLVVNPGGPGASGVEFATNAPEYFGPEVLRAFDVVGFDPRGVGRSTPVQCLSDAALDALVASDPDPETTAEVTASERRMAAFGESCLAESGELAAHVSTVEAARDIDIIRQALGDRRLSYFGASYGTLLGATYADLFPERVGRMVLDGAVDPSLSNTRKSLAQARGFEVALRAYVGECVGREGCFLGDTVDEGTQRIRRFLDDVDREPIQAEGGRDLKVGNAVLGVWMPLYNRAFWPALDAALQAGFGGDGSQLLRLSDAYTSRGPEGYVDNSVEALYAITCLDPGEWLAAEEVAPLVSRFEKVSPTFGAVFAYGLAACSPWPVRSEEAPRRLRAEGSDPILVVGTTRDPATPLAWAQALAAQLDAGLLVTRDGDGHTGYNSGNACVDATVDAYLVAGTVPPSDVSC